MTGTDPADRTDAADATTDDAADNAAEADGTDPADRTDAADATTDDAAEAGSTDAADATAGDGVVHYSEPGTTLWRLGLGPALAALGFVTELILGQPSHWPMWIITGAGLFALNGVWVYARRTFLRVRVTGTALVQGTETLPIADIASVLTSEPRLGTRVLGGNQTVPRGFEPVELELADRKHVLAWSRDSETFTAALRTAMRNSRRD